MAHHIHESYGKIEARLAQEFVAAGVTVYPVGRPVPYDMRGWLGHDWCNNNLGVGMAEVTLSFYRPQAALQAGVQTSRMWLYTMSESTQVGRDWVDTINQWYERVFVPSEIMAEVYRESGVKKPVDVVPLGIDFEVPRKVNRKPWLNEEPFIFLTHDNGLDDRKGGKLAVEAFRQAFGGEIDYRLWIKSIYTRDTWLETIDDPQIAVVPGKLNQPEWWELLAGVHAVVYLSYGEGFGLVPREATIMQTPVIGTQAHGMQDIDQWGVPVRVGEEVPVEMPHEEANSIGGLWWQADVPTAAQKMRYLAKHYDEALQIAEKGRKYLLERHSYRNMAEGILKWL
jgi:glycosyltransferase involved in cell wall biosynthesis